MVVSLTFVLIKPDAVRRGLVGEILSRFERKGLRIRGLKMLKMSRELAERLYEAHRGKDFYGPLVDFMTSGPVVAVVLEGESAVEVVRTMIGPTDGTKAPPGTIRGDYSLSTRENLVHASDSRESAEREIKLFFREDELV